MSVTINPAPGKVPATSKMPDASQPLVSIGLPTYNRAAHLKRAIDSVLAQDYWNIELVISDNASTDETEVLCLEAYQRDNRIKYFRQKSNQGPLRNFHEVLRLSHGDFFMWLSDDDWLDRSYVADCMQFLTTKPDYVVVCGTSKYFRDGKLEFEGEVINLGQATGPERVAAYYERVSHNGIFYGVMRRRYLVSAPLPSVLGGDWLAIAALAFKGKIETLASTSVSRSLGGMSRDMKSITSGLGISNLHARAPLLSIAVAASKDIAWKSEAYASLGRGARLALARRVFLVFTRRFFKPYWWAALYPYWARPILFAISVRNKIRKKMLGRNDD